MAAVTFDTLTDVKKSQRMLFLSADNTTFKPIAYSTSANLSFSADDIDVSNKSDGGWSTSMQGKKSAEISVDGLVAVNENMYAETDLFTAYNTGAKLYFKYVYVTVTEAADGLSTTVEEDATKPYYTGRCTIGSLELTSDNGDVCKYSATLNAQGTVTKH